MIETVGMVEAEMAEMAVKEKAMIDNHQEQKI